MKKFYITILLFISIVCISHGQRLNIYGHYMVKNSKNLFGHGMHLSLNLEQDSAINYNQKYYHDLFKEKSQF